MIRRLLAFLSLAVLSAALPAAAQDSERILSYHSDITVNPDASLLVRETIRVRARGQDIRRGIFRDFPTRYRDKSGVRTVGFELLEVQRDGQTEPYHTEQLANGIRIYVGREDLHLEPGEYTYTLVYRTTRQLGLFQHHDELYWNVTGNDWKFPIDEATAAVHLPAGVAPQGIKTEAYTGWKGSKDKNYAAEVDAEGVARFRTTAPLDPYEGLTIVVGWPKGFVVPNDERILTLASDVTVHPDDSLVVRETIRVRARGEEIPRGIVRDLPTVFRVRWLFRRKASFELLEVQRNGQPEDSRVEHTDTGVRIQIGNDARPLPPGEHTYTLLYRTTRRVGFFGDYDELAWDATGSGWGFAIDEAAATVRLPGGIPPDRIAVEAFIGEPSAEGSDSTASVDADGSVRVRTTAPLGYNRALTAVVRWPKGFVKEPALAERIGLLLEDNPEFLPGGVGLLVVFLYYLIAWFAVGRDPAPGTIVTLYEPPEGCSPAAIRYLTREGYDDKAFTASVLNMAIQGYLNIHKADGLYTLARAGADPGVLSPEEQKIGEALFASGPQLEIKAQNHQAVDSATHGLEAFLQGKFKADYFRANLPYVLPGLLVSAAVTMAMIGASAGHAMFGPLAVVVGGVVVFWSLFAVLLARKALARWKRVAGGGALADLIVAAVISIFVLTIGGIGFLGLVVLGFMTSILVFIAVLTLLVTNLLFLYLLKAPTRAARALLDKVEGFKEFLTAVEGDRMKRMSVPDITLGLFERFLPHAVALDVEQVWTQKFQRAMAAAGQAPNQVEYSPVWFSGDHWDLRDSMQFTSSMNSLSREIASASDAPGSSSGFSGGSDFGGSSGGGGGGGGGGGW